jgi:pantetheine-phosphate adenylyltransferase
MSATPGHGVAVYTGVFDPIHLGHLDIIGRGSHIFDRLIVGVGNNPEKAPWFTLEERVQLVRRVVAPWRNVEVRAFDGLAVHFVRAAGAGIMLRGLRTTSDMDYEFTMSLTNRTLDPDIETVFLLAKETYSHLSGTLLRQIAAYGGELEKFVPPEVKTALEARRREREARRG